jgi:hypothetical protein
MVLFRKWLARSIVWNAVRHQAGHQGQPDQVAGMFVEQSKRRHRRQPEPTRVAE